MSNIKLSPLAHRARNTDPSTSWEAAAASVKGVSPASLYWTARCMSDVEERIDEELWLAVRHLTGIMWDKDVVIHSRIAIARHNFAVETGAVRKTSSGRNAKLWVALADIKNELPSLQEKMEASSAWQRLKKKAKIKLMSREDTLRHEGRVPVILKLRETPNKVATYDEIADWMEMYLWELMK